MITSINITLLLLIFPNFLLIMRSKGGVYEISVRSTNTTSGPIHILGKFQTAITLQHSGII